jgi:hypothetical protein
VGVGLGRGLRLEVAADSSLHSHLGTAELEIAPHVRRLAVPGTVCFDIGCHDGFYAMAFARLTGAPVVGFEPDRDALARIRRNLARNPEAAADVTVRGERVSHRPGETLDELLAGGEVPAPGLLKIDVDGDEAAVLLGARATLAAHRPHAVVEVHGVDLERHCAALLGDAGYRVRVVSQRKRLPQSRPAAHNRWLIATHAG